MFNRIEMLNGSEMHACTKRLLKLSNGEVSTEAIRNLLKMYLGNAPRTYNNIIDALKAFIGRYLGRVELLNGLKHTYVPENYETQLPTKEQLKKGFEETNMDLYAKNKT